MHVELETPCCNQQPPILSKSLHPCRSSTNCFIPVEPKNYSGNSLVGISHLSRVGYWRNWGLLYIPLKDRVIFWGVLQESKEHLTGISLNLRETWDLSKGGGTRSPSFNQNIRGVKHWTDPFRNLIPAPQALFSCTRMVVGSWFCTYMFEQTDSACCALLMSILLGSPIYPPHPLL